MSYAAYGFFHIFISLLCHTVISFDFDAYHCCRYAPMISSPGLIDFFAPLLPEREMRCAYGFTRCASAALISDIMLRALCCLRALLRDTLLTMPPPF